MLGAAAEESEAGAVGETLTQARDPAIERERLPVHGWLARARRGGPVGGARDLARVAAPPSHAAEPGTHES